MTVPGEGEAWLIEVRRPFVGVKRRATMWGCPTRFAIGLALLLFLNGCQSFDSEPAAASEPAASKQRETINPDSTGYALLFDLLGDEKNVAKIRFIKRPRPAMTELLKEISQVSGDAHKRLEQFAKADKSLNLVDPHLPMGEIAARKAISKTKEKALLFGKGKGLEIELLLTQQEAMNYGAHLAKTIAVGETQPERRRFLQDLSLELSRLEDKLVGHLSEHYTFPEEK